MTRRRERDGAKYFGPFYGSTSVHVVLKLIRQYYPPHTCKSMMGSAHVCNTICITVRRALIKYLPDYRKYIDEIVELF